MSTLTLLKIIESRQPDLVKEARELIAVSEPDAVIVRKVYAHCFLIHKSGDEFRDCLIFVASVLSLYSPETLIAECKVRSGVCLAIAEQLQISQSLASYYVKHAKHYYSNLVAVKEAVDRVVERFGTQTESSL